MTISSSQELNWPGCDGFGTIVKTKKTIRIGASVEWYGLRNEIAPSVYEYNPLNPKCSSHAICGNDGVLTDNSALGYIKETIPWISFGGSPAPYGPGYGFCLPIAPLIRTANPPGVQGATCFDFGQ